MRTGCWSPPKKCAPLRTSGRKRPLSGTQHSFHETKRETLKRARPQVVTSRDNRLTDTSRDGREKGGGDAQRTVNAALPVKNAGTDKPSSLRRTDCVYYECKVKEENITFSHSRLKFKKKICLMNYPKIPAIRQRYITMLIRC